MKAVKFIKNYSPYKDGDIAGLPDAEADTLEQSGIVELYQKNGGSAKKSEVKEEPKEKMQEEKKSEQPDDQPEIEEKAVDSAPIDKMVKNPVKKK